MRRVIRYLDFLEAISVNATDDAVTRMDKENANDDDKDLADYNKKKERLKQIFTQTDPKTGQFIYDDQRLQKELDTLVGKEENPFIKELLTVLGMERRIAAEEKKSIDKTIRMEDLKSKIDIGDDATKKDLGAKVKGLEQEMADDTKVKADLATELKKKQDEFFRNMAGNKDRMNKTATRLKAIKPK